MKNGTWLALAIGALLAGGLLLLARTWLALPAAVLLLALPVVLSGWLQTRASLARHFARQPEIRWASGDEPQPEPEIESELQELGYEPAGSLWVEGAVSRVYLHRELPVYVLAARVPGQRKGMLCTLHSFFEEGGWLVTASYPFPELFSAGLGQAAPRLAQYRPSGTPTALDGQHVGTVRAWAAGKRRPLPAAAEALPGYLRADHA
ncbi:MAG TPA: hypothetical protein VFU47_05310, partial [Armatimonadota bacterium]|nr:hypothetical protein [Armatimonadota bacterium]